MPSAYEGTDITSCLRSKYIIRRKPYIILRSNISFLQGFEFIRKTAENIFFLFCGYKVEMRTTEGGPSTQPKRRDSLLGLPKSRVRQVILGTARSGQNHADAEYPPAPTKTRNRPKGRFFVLHYASCLICSVGIRLWSYITSE